MGVVWSDHEFTNPPVAGDDVVATLSSELGRRLPPDYLEIARANQGRTPEPCEFRLPDGSNHVFNNLIALDPALDRNWNVAKATRELVGDGVFPDGLVAFGDTPGGDFLAFDLREMPENPPVVCVMHDDPGFPIKVIAENFAAFLAGLHD